MSVWVDAHHPAIEVRFDTDAPTTVTATAELWRVKQTELPSVEVSDIYFDRSQKPVPQRQPTLVEPDKVLHNLPPGQIGWIHHNIKSVGPALTAELQGLSDLKRPDPLLNRVFGAIVEADEGQRVDEQTLQLPASKRHHLTIYVHTEQPSTRAASSSSLGMDCKPAR